MFILANLWERSIRMVYFDIKLSKWKPVQLEYGMASLSGYSDQVTMRKGPSFISDSERKIKVPQVWDKSHQVSQRAQRVQPECQSPM